MLANGKTPGETTAFLISRSKKAFETGGMGPIEGIGARAKNAIEALKPYQGGNEALWRLHRLDAADKHRILLIVGLGFRQLTLLLKAPGATEGIGLALALNHEDAKFFPLEDGAYLFPEFFEAMSRAAIPNVEQEFKLGFSIAFGESEVVKGEPLVPTLIQLADYIEGVIESFEPLFNHE